MKIVVRPLRDFTDSTIDLNDFCGSSGHLFVRDGIGIAGRGVITRTDHDGARSILESLEVDGPQDHPGTRPLVIGALPFDRRAAGEFVLPEQWIIKTEDGTEWFAHVEGSTPNLDIPPRPLASTNSFQVRPGIEVERYLSAVGAIRDAVRSGEITKAVIARDVIVEASDPIDVHGLLLRLKASFGSSYRYSFDGFIGASPELLVEIRGSEIFSHPLAGTTPRTGDPVTDERLAAELLASPKNQIEHRVVIDMVHDTLLPHCSFLDWEPEPTVVKVANVQHLGTRLQGALSTPRLHVLDAARMLSPTPALGGFPRDAALELIERHEGLDRGRYGGAVGWFDSRGDGSFAVAIRCADLSADRRTARLFAGGGIVAESEPLSELAETQAKFQAMLAAIIRP
ncbi:MAG: isochorismate synthase [Actinobacteria bacterium]|nr:isochorismate synthase [Actinomycetota bacterium]